MSNIQKQNTQLKPVDKLKSIINSPTVQEQFKNAMGKNSDLFVASVIDAFGGLQDCEPASVIQEALKAAVLKLPISKGLGFAYLVPYNRKFKDNNGKWQSVKEAQFQIGYKGLTQLALRSGQVKRLNAGSVYPGQFISFTPMSEDLDMSGERKKGNPVGYFAYMQLINGFEKTVYWTREQVIEHAEKYSQSYTNKKSAWTTAFDSMATKTPLKFMLSHFAPMSIEFLTVMAQDDAIESEPKDITDLTDQLGDEPASETKTESGGAKPQFGQET